MKSRRFSLDNTPHQNFCLQYRAFSQVQFERRAPEKVDPPGQASGNQSRCVEKSKITSRTLGNNTKTMLTGAIPESDGPNEPSLNRLLFELNVRPPSLPL